LPANGLRLLHLSDTHFHGAEWREQAKINCIRKACAGLEYDLLIHTGDFLHYDSGLPNVLNLLDAIPAPRVGSYAVFGNHDYTVYSHGQMLPRAWANFQARQQGQTVAEAVTVHSNGIASRGVANYNNRSNGSAGNTPASTQFSTNASSSNGHVKANGYAAGHATPFTHARTLIEFGQYFANVPFDLKRTGKNNVNALESALTARQIHLLHNRSVRITNPDIGLDIYMAGVDDVVEGRPELNRALQEIPYDAPTILLCHNPDILAVPGIEQADLVLSGHTHGGQVVLPLLGAAHTQTEHLKRKEVSGYLSRGKTQIYITRGVGEGIPLRFGAAPQITLITVLPA
jgi:predicted MPP superfamily phosphohydrolase